MNSTSSNPSEISIKILRGVGPKMLEKLHKCGIATLQDLFFHFPMRYQDRTHVTPIINLLPNEYAVIEGIIGLSEVSKGRRASLLLKVHDGSAAVTIRFFHFNAAQKKNLTEGLRLRCFGEVRSGFKGLEMVHPEYRCINSTEPVSVEENLTPIYPSTEGLSQSVFRKLTDQALNLLEKDFTLREFLPTELINSLNLPNLNEAILFIHRPPPDAAIKQLVEGTHPAQRRLAFEELLAHRLSLRKLRAQIQQYSAPQFKIDNLLTQAFLHQLPFNLTGAQERVIREIKNDLVQPYPMLRLLQGDVGSGKTIVAALAILEAVASGYQAVLMAPTDILAEQHYHNFYKWLKPLNIEIVWLAGKHKGKHRKNALDKLADGTAQIAIGTHALFQEDVEFNKLGLVIIDEQHRFGVHQRLALREKGIKQNTHPHQLIMTATPIPRTLSMTAYADLDVSVIDALPSGRTPVKTVVIPETKRSNIIQRIKAMCQQGRQIYWVCPLINESEVLQCQAAEKTNELLQQQLPNLKIGLIHGRLKSKEKEQVMQSFISHELDLLVATTVIEVGVDVPNASLMIIENAERLGLSQLHQLRGRVGRGITESYCVLLYHDPLSFLAKARLSILRESSDGFLIAQKDLELRGPGEVLGTKQTGLIQFRIAELKRDTYLLPTIQRTSEVLMAEYPESVDLIIQRWLGESDKFGVV